MRSVLNRAVNRFHDHNTSSTFTGKTSGICLDVSIKDLPNDLSINQIDLKYNKHMQRTVMFEDTHTLLKTHRHVMGVYRSTAGLFGQTALTSNTLKNALSEACV